MRPDPDIQFAHVEDGVDVAYWTLGEGPVLIHTPNVQFSHLRAEWAIEPLADWYRGLARTHRLVRYDHRGAGLSTRGPCDFSLDAMVRDIDAVVRDTGAERVALLGYLSGALPAIAYAARHPERVSHLVVWNGFARDAVHGQAPRLRSLLAMASGDWDLFTESIAQAALGWRDVEQARAWARVERAATTQAEFLDFIASRRSWDVGPLLADVQAPTLVLHDAINALASEDRNRELATGIPGARFAAAGSRSGLPDQAAAAKIVQFLRS